MLACQDSIPFQIGCFENFPRPDWISQVKKDPDLLSQKMAQDKARGKIVEHTWPERILSQTNSALYSAFWSVEPTDFKNVIFENIHWALFEVAEVKQPRNPKRQKF